MSSKIRRIFQNLAEFVVSVTCFGTPSTMVFFEIILDIKLRDNYIFCESNPVRTSTPPLADPRFS